MKVLIVDDDAFKAREIRETLENLKIQDIDWRESKKSGLEALEQEKYDFLVLDMYFPLEDGGDEVPCCGLLFLKEMKEKQIELPVIVCSTARMDFSDCDMVRGTVWYRWNADLYFTFYSILSDIFSEQY